MLSLYISLPNPKHEPKEMSEDRPKENMGEKPGLRNEGTPLKKEQERTFGEPTKQNDTEHDEAAKREASHDFSDVPEDETPRKEELEMENRQVKSKANGKEPSDGNLRETQPMNLGRGTNSHSHEEDSNERNHKSHNDSDMLESIDN